MLFKKPADIKPSEITPPQVYAARRALLKAAMAGLAVASRPTLAMSKAPSAEAPVEAPRPRGEPMQDLVATAYGEGLEPTAYSYVTGYNNFYEFGTDKTDPAKYAVDFDTENWKVKVGGACEKSGEFLLEDIIQGVDIEERIYRLRCVEAWSMVIPWNGFELADLLNMAGVQGKAKYVRFETVYRPEELPLVFHLEYTRSLEQGGRAMPNDRVLAAMQVTFQ